MTVPIGGRFHIQHGVSNAMFMPSVHAYSVEGAPERYAVAAKEMGAANWEDDDSTACRKLIDELRALNKDLGLPSLQDYGVDRDEYLASVEAMTRVAFETGVPSLNPRVPSTEDVAALYRAVWEDSWTT
jgi:alcohol dehydrogenase class IV